MRDEVTGDCAAKRREKRGGEGGGGKKRWFNVRAPLSLWSEPSSALLCGEHESASAETGQIHRNSHRAKGMGK